MLTFAGWAVAVSGFAAVLLVLRERTVRMEAVARACHELRGPLTAARLGLALGARTGELSRARLRAVDLELGRASLALEDLADAGSGVGYAPAYWERVDVRELLEDSAEAWRAAAHAAGAVIETSWRGGPAQVTGDRFRLAQATGNLIANAIEHGEGTIRVSGRLHGQGVRIEVVDDGPGLPAPPQEASRRARRRRRGRGRGLTIAAAIAASHEGSLSAAPSTRGARVLIDLPLARGLGHADTAGE